MNLTATYEVIVIGVSSGGPQALNLLLPALPAGFRLPLIIVQHIGSYSENHWIHTLQQRCALPIAEAEEKETIRPGRVYVAPANYHLLVESDRSFSLTVDARVNYARPSIDVLFESVARVYRDKAVGIILTGANSDGAIGLKKIKDAGGLAIVQEPATADSPSMPNAAIRATPVDYILPLEQIIATISTTWKL